MSEYEPNAKAIETIVGGYRMRSRLEARWATFFNAMKIDWIYEPEGFVFPSGRYLPDFYLPRVKMYAEVKPEPFNERELRLATELVLATGKPIIQLDGSPDVTNYWAIELDASGKPYWSDLLWEEGHNYYETENRFFGNSGCANGYPIRTKMTEMGLGHDFCHFEDAVKIARAARFGERGEP